MRLQLADLSTLTGGYCEDAKGTYRPTNTSAAFEVKDACTLSVDANGVFSLGVGEHIIAASSYVASVNEALKGSYVISAVNFDPAESRSVGVTISHGRVVSAFAKHALYLPNSRLTSNIEEIRCAFRNPTTLGASLAADQWFVTASDLPATLAGTYNNVIMTGTQEDPKFVPCSINVSGNGAVTLSGPTSPTIKDGNWGASITISAPLDGFGNIYRGQVSAQHSTDDDFEPVNDGHITLTVYNGKLAVAQGSNSSDHSFVTCPVAPDVPESDDRPDNTKSDPGPPDCVCTAGTNPIHVGVGNKYQHERDFSGPGPMPLLFDRHYNSTAVVTSSHIGANWRSNLDRAIAVRLDAGVSKARVYRPEGKVYEFTLSGGVWRADADINGSLMQLRDASNNPIGWKYLNDNDDTEMYAAAGNLQSIQDRHGVTQTFGYDIKGRRSQVKDYFGRTLLFTFDEADRIQTMTDPAGGQYLYAYDGMNNLKSVTYPDGKVRSYVYEQATLPHALTGIIDENNARYATWHYDSRGRAYSSEHAAGADKFTVTYNNDGSRTVTDPVNTSRGYQFKSVLGAVKYAGQSQPAGTGCSAASSSVSYDDNGNIAIETDFKGMQTKYGYDKSRNLMTSMTEAYQTPLARTTTTEWHPGMRLPTRIAEPKRMTTYTYYPNGTLSTKTLQATSDLSGEQGLTAPAIGVARTWRYTYDAAGQIYTITGPRSDVADMTTYTYDPMGNLATVKNALGHLTTLSNYDANGHVGKIVAPSGVVTELTYKPRGWLDTHTVTDAGVVHKTGYGYDGVGNLKTVTLPDQSVITYGYDDAHRLTDLTDSLGNHIHYVLDNLGKRTNETVMDGSNMLKRQVDRIYDDLNRLKAVTGAAQ